MQGEGQQPDLSVIIPTLNEATTLPLLLADLAAQQHVAFEVLVSDGDSCDGTPELATQTMTRLGLAGAVLTGAAGRGRQLNRGAAAARGAWLLLLHADSRLPGPATLAAALACLRRERNPRLAGHFPLRFDLPAGERDFASYLGETRARTGFPGTIHGDQGFLLATAFFRELGGFREDLPVLEDTLLAEAVRARGGWRLLPGEIVTSPRRFRAEGHRQRQTLNALLVNFAMIGWEAPLQRIPALYRSQDQARPLHLADYFRQIDELLAALPWRERCRIWQRTGRFVQANAWQLPLRHLARRARAAGLPPAAVPLAPLQTFMYRCERLTGHVAGQATAAALTWLWFRTRRRTPYQGDA